MPRDHRRAEGARRVERRAGERAKHDRSARVGETRGKRRHLRRSAIVDRGAVKGGDDEERSNRLEQSRGFEADRIEIAGAQKRRRVEQRAMRLEGCRERRGGGGRSYKLCREIEHRL